MYYGTTLCGIDLRQGLIRSGKTYTAMCDALDRLFRGGVFGSNCRLADDWHYQAALLHPKYDGTIDTQNRIASALAKRAYLIGAPHTLLHFSRIVAQNAVGKVKGTEHAGVILIDECGTYMPPQKWKENAKWVDQMAMLGKRGCDCILIAHDLKLIDTKVREFRQWDSKCINLHRETKIPLINMSYPDMMTDAKTDSPLPAFMLFKRPKQGTRKIFFFYKFRPVIAGLYFTKEEHSADALPQVVEIQSSLQLERELVSVPGAVARERWKSPGRNRYWLDMLDLTQGGHSVPH